MIEVAGTNMSESIFNTLPTPPKSKVSILRELLPGIESALRAGHQHLAIYEHIRDKLGLEISYHYYVQALHRIRKRESLGVRSRKDDRQVNSAAPVRAVVAATKPNTDPGKKRFTYDLHKPVEDFFN